MIRAFLFAIVAVLIAFIAVWLKDNPAVIEISWLGYHISTSLVFVLFALCILWFVLKIIVIPFNFLDFLERKEKERKEKNEKKLLIDFLTATGNNDSLKYAGLGRRIDTTFKDKPKLRDLMLLSISSGETRQTVIENLSKEKNTELLALKSKIETAEEDNNKEDTLALYLDAFKKYPKADFIPPKLIPLLALFGKWDELQDIATQAFKNGTFTKARYKQIKSSALLEQGLSTCNDDLIKQAAEVDYENVAAVINASRSYLKQGDNKKAFVLLKKLWQVSPSFNLYEAILLVLANEPPYKRLKKVEKLLNSSSDFPLRTLLLADIYAKSDLIGKAKELLNQYESKNLSSPLLTRIKAEIANIEAPDSPNAKNLMDLAASSPLPPSWQCDDCSHLCFEWHSICPSCDSFGTLSTKES